MCLAGRGGGLGWGGGLLLTGRGGGLGWGGGLLAGRQAGGPEPVLHLGGDLGKFKLMLILLMRFRKVQTYALFFCA